MFSNFLSQAKNYIIKSQNEKVKEPFKYFFNREFFDVEIYTELPSTNDYLKEVETENEKAVIALSQTKGRGRFQRIFFSPKNQGLYTSVVIKRDLPPEDAFKITAYAGVVVLDAIKKFTNIDAKIKWVNDVIINGKKVAGILTETTFDTKKKCVSKAVVGIGLNLYGDSFDKSIENIATSLEKESGVKVDFLEFALCVYKGLYKVDKELKSGNFMEKYRANSCVIDKEVLVSSGSENYSAKVLDILETGELKILKNGETKILNSGEISVKIAERK